ncbi:MAG: ABC transporter permease [Spirochaetales bacterium]
MKPTILIKLSFRSIFRNRMRSLLTTLGIIIGVSSVIIMVAIGEGSQAQIRDTINSMGSNLIVVRPPRGRWDANRLTLKDTERIRSEATLVSAVSGTLRRSVTIVGGMGDWSTTLYGVEPDYQTIKEWELKEGEFINEQDMKSRRKVAVLGTTVAENLFGSEMGIGQTIRIGNAPFKVIGVLKSRGTNSMGQDQDDVVLVPITTALVRMSRDPYLSDIQISAVSEEKMTEAQEEVEAIVRESHRLREDRENDFEILNQSQIIEVASSTAKTLTILLAAIAGVSLVVGGIGIMNIMLVSVTERTREIGVRLAVGARWRDILLQFLTESIVLSLLGGLIGILFSLGVVATLEKFTPLHAIVNPVFILISAGFAGSVGVFFGYYPARKASALNPIEALRTE